VRRFRLHAACVLALLLAAAPLTAQSGPTLLSGVTDSAAFAQLRFRSIGPAVMSGRIADIAVPPAAEPGERLGKTVYVATAAGGVWKTTNAGATYTPIFDDQRVSSIGSIAIAPTDANTIWVGTGESNNLRSSSWGDGIYRSTDGGATWTHMGLRGTQHLPRIVVHPRDPNTVFVAAMGPLWAPGGERGFYKTTDGGRTWRNTKALGPYTGFTDIVLDPNNPNVIYATSYQRDRRAYSFVAGGPESGIWKSTDGGETWTGLTNGLPTGDLGRIGIDVARSQPRTLYATIHADSGGIFRSDDGGATWTKTNTLQSIPWFFGQIRVDPRNPERIYHLGVSLSVSDDGGRTFRSIAQRTHADHHAMWIDPNDSDHLMLGNDGGFYFSHDRGRTGDCASKLPVSTFYAIGVDMRDPYWVYGGLQDNGTWGAPNRTFGSQGPTNYDWLRAGGGDGFYAAIDPTNPNIVFVESQNGALSRFDWATHESRSIRPAVEPGDPAHRYNWMAPLLISPHDSRTLYFGSQFLVRSNDHGDSWTKVSADLTRNLNRDTLPIMGMKGPGGLGRHDGTAEFGNLATIDESPRRAGVLVTGSDDGVIGLTKDGGRTWTRVERFPRVPEMTYVSRVVASAHDENVVYATFDGHRSNDFRPYVLKSTDFGRTWTNIASNLPDGSVYVIREHARTPNLLFVGAEYGVFVSVNGGRTWSKLENGIAPAPVHDLVIHPRDNDLVVGTHGRGIYILDDISALERVAARSGSLAIDLVTPRPATIHGTRRSPSVFGDRNYSGQNRPAGATLTYIVTGAAQGQGTLVIRDAQGNVVRELGASLTPGIHRVQWDLRHASPAPAAPQPARNNDDDDDDGPPQQRGQQQGPAGPFVAAGAYTVELRGANAQSVAQSRIQVLLDPAVALTPAQYADLGSARMSAYQLQRQLHGMITQLESEKRRLEAAMQGRDAHASIGAARQLLADIDSALNRMRPAPRRPGQGGGPQNFVSSGAATAQPAQPLQTQINGVASQLNATHFMPTPAHRTTIRDVTAGVAEMTPLVAALAQRVTATIAQLQ